MERVFDTKILPKESFPPLLSEINDPPKELYFRGTIPKFENYKILTIVGSRRLTEYGKRVCEKFIPELKGYPIIIVSGMALGVDSLVHELALKNKILTIAIPGSGLNDRVLYPKSNFRLAKKILENEGLLLSEYKPDFNATQWSFPRRNRIMAGISHATLVIEASEKSGTLITSKLATEYNRDVFTVPGSIFDTARAGPHMLLKLGAKLIENTKDILDGLGLESDETHSEHDYSDLSENEILVMEHLEEPISREELSAATHLMQNDLGMSLSLLELRGFIKESLGKIYKI